MMVLSFCTQKSKLPLIGIAVLFLSFVETPQACAGEVAPNSVAVLKFASGVVAAFSIHEASHLLVAEIADSELHFKSGNINQPIGFTEESKSDEDALALLSAGLISQIVGSEVILQTDNIDKNVSFIRGMMAWNILNPISYAVDYWFIHRSNFNKRNSYSGDIQGIENYSSEQTANGFAISMVALSIFQGYRFVKTQSWAPEKFKKKSHDMTFESLPSKGFLLAYKIKF